MGTLDAQQAVEREGQPTLFYNGLQIAITRREAESIRNALETCVDDDHSQVIIIERNHWTIVVGPEIPIAIYDPPEPAAPPVPPATPAAGTFSGSMLAPLRKP
ncbi:Uncharacterised protein [Mycobacteroides abscessus subsp. bolletii]|uniref:hypothetical protein n=1 Tax=Mycobacteroides abscessus TaxID=36809 RepID=UPI0009A7559A|nr:hypothetical protein [Mycobacteroides abscessus]SLI07875.1 Uncharacterised protein [Mycobacteroides abscessus subsp. bolletii]